MKRFVLFFFIVMAWAGSSRAQSIVLTNVFPIYAMDFDDPILSISTVTWTDNSTIPGWYAASTGTAITNLTANNGSSTTGSLYNYASTFANTDRSLGSLNSNTIGDIRYGVLFTNGSPNTITTIRVQYTGEQWRNGGSSNLQDILYFDYSTSSTSISSGTYTSYPFLNFNSPQYGGFPVPGTALDGNMSSNRISYNAFITGLSIPQNGTIMLRWTDLNIANNDNGMSIDDIIITATYAPAIFSNTVNTPPFTLTDCLDTETGSVDFTTSGTFNVGNTFDVQLSDAIGSFTSPVVIGTLTGAGAEGPSPSGNIGFTIPAGTVSGSGYRVRIVSSNPASTGIASSAFQIIQQGLCGSSQSDAYRSVVSGDWSNVATWESQSPDNPAWIAATLTPTNLSGKIQVRNGHTVSITSNVSIDEVAIESGGMIDHTGGTITIEDGASDDVDIQNGGIFRWALASTPPVYGTGSPTINVATGGILRVAAGGMTGAGAGVNASNVVYQHQSIFEWAPSGAASFSTSGVTYFPNVALTTIPIFRCSNPISIRVGATANTDINGIFESAGAGITWEGTGAKTFRNGITGAANVTAEIVTAPLSGNFIIKGETAELGGSGIITAPNGGIIVGSIGGTTVSLTSNKTITGNIILASSGNTYIDAGTFNLTVSGTITGGATNRYVRTASSGSLILQSVGTKDFPVGHSKYNPITIQTGSGHDWTVNVNDGVTADIPQTTLGAVLATWNITPSVNPPAAPTNITFYFDSTLAGGQIGADFNNPAHNTPDNVQVWHRKLGWWLASGTTVPVQSGAPIAGYVSATALNAQDFSPYGISRVSLPLPIKLVSFTATKVSSSLAIINWELSACCSRDALFELERSADGQNFSLLSSISGSETNKYYFYNDSRLSKGTNYYRLKMTDTDGSVKYSKIIAIVNEEKGFVITSVAPNPVQHTASLTISAAKQESIQFTVYDLHGSVVKQWQSNVAAGVNVVTMDVASLSNGTYHVLAASPDGRTVIRFMKQ